MLWLALAAATRTEALAVASALLGLLAISQAMSLLGAPRGLRAALRRSLAALIRPVSELAAVLVPLLVFRRLYFGSWVPNSVVAKDGFFRELRAMPLFDMVRRLSHEQGLSMLTDFGKARAGYLLLLVPLGLLSARYRRQTSTILLVVTLLGSIVIWNNGDWMPHWRLLVPVIPFIWVAVAWALTLIRSPDTWPRWTGVFQLVVAITTFAYGIERSFYVRGLASQPNPVVDYMLDLGRALSATQTGNEVLATDMAGRVPYASRLRTLDLFGLCDAHIARYGTPTLHMGKIDHSYVYRKRPDFYFYNVTGTVRAMIQSPDFQPYASDYLVIATPFATKSANHYGKILLARKSLPHLTELVHRLDAKLVLPQSL